MSSGTAEGREGLRTSKEGSFAYALCFSWVGTSLPAIPRPILHSNVTELNGIYPAGLRTLLTVAHLMTLSLSSYLAVQVTVNFLLTSLMSGVKSNKVTARSQNSSGWMRDAVQTVLGRMDWEWLHNSACAVP